MGAALSDQLPGSRLGGEVQKYDIVFIAARPNRTDQRVESWRPDVASLRKEEWLPAWTRRRPHIEPYIEDSMCDVFQAVREDPPAKSLALVRPKEILDVIIEPHPGWSIDEQAKINAYVSQIDMFGTDRTPLEAPRFKGRPPARAGRPRPAGAAARSSSRPWSGSAETGRCPTSTTAVPLSAT